MRDCGSICSEMQFLQLHQDVVTLNAQRIAGGFCSRRMRGLAGGQIKFPLVPGADNLAVVHCAFGEWTAAMRADIVERQGNSLERGHAECVTLNREFFGLGFRWKLLPTAQPDPLTHLGTLYTSLVRCSWRMRGFDSSIFPLGLEQAAMFVQLFREEKLRFAGLRECT